MMGKLVEGARVVLRSGMIAASNAQKNLGGKVALYCRSIDMYAFGIHPWFTLSPSIVHTQPSYQ